MNIFRRSKIKELEYRVSSLEGYHFIMEERHNDLLDRIFFVEQQIAEVRKIVVLSRLIPKENEDE